MRLLELGLALSVLGAVLAAWPTPAPGHRAPGCRALAAGRTAEWILRDLAAAEAVLEPGLGRRRYGPWGESLSLRLDGVRVDYRLVDGRLVRRVEGGDGDRDHRTDGWSVPVSAALFQRRRVGDRGAEVVRIRLLVGGVPIFTAGVPGRP